MVISDEDHLSAVGNYRPGSIVHIKLKNFLTYNYVEFVPGPRLNIVMGANGTGKSSILNAICLGLGGEPKLLGRADDARAFITSGQDKADIEITLAALENDDTTPTVFRRVIDRQKGSENGRGRGASSFFLDGKQVNAVSVKEAVAKYNITIDNLCTFLPQDKVGSFSGFDARQLLVETEKTLSSSQHLYRTHLELIEKEGNLQEGVVNVESLKSRLEKLKKEIEPLERARGQMEEREQAVCQADLMRKKKVWLEFDELRVEVIKMQERKKAIKGQASEANALLAPLQLRVQELASKEKMLDTKFRNLDKATQVAKGEIEKQLQKYENHEDKIEDIMASIQEVDSSRSQLIKAFEKAQNDFDRLQAHVKTIPDSEEVEAELKAAQDDRRQALQRYQAAKRDAQDHANQLDRLNEEAKQQQGKVAKLNDEGARRKEKIFRQYPNLAKICDWLNQNRGKFRRDVWGPVVCEIQPSTDTVAAIVEQHVPNASLKSFICETKEDQDLLYSEVREKMNIPINVLLVKNGQLDPVRRQLSESDLQKVKKDFALEGYLDELFDAPDAIMQAVRNQARVHDILVGDRKAYANMKKLMDVVSDLAQPPPGQQRKPDVCIACSDGRTIFKFTGTVSRYSGKLSERQDQLVPATLLAKGVDANVKKAAEDALARIHRSIDQLRPELEQAETQKNEFELKAQEKETNWKAAKNRKEGIAKYYTKLAFAQSKRDDAEEALKKDDSREKKTLVKQLMNCVAGSILALETHAGDQQRMMQSTVLSAGVMVSKTVVTVASRKAIEEEREAASQFRKLKEEMDHVNAAYSKAKAVAKAKESEAKRLAPLVDDRGDDNGLKQQLEAIEFYTLDALQAALDDLEQKINSIVENKEAVRRYEELIAEIEQTEVRLEDVTESKENKLKELKAICAPWEKTLDNAASEINKVFSKYMAEMGCTGEVRLHKGDKESTGNFQDWGIQIKVSFRDGTAAQILSARVQSGGERSVSTIMYLMALQNRMVAPFRCVDEINQGLDERNERLVFRRIVENSTKRPGKSLTDHHGQYFLITPKLLPGLYDIEQEAVTCLFVYNGAYNFDLPQDWDVEKFLQATQKKGKRKKCFDEDEIDDAENIVNGGARSKKSARALR